MPRRSVHTVYMTSTAAPTAAKTAAIKAHLRSAGDAELIECIATLEAIPAAKLTKADRTAYAYAVAHIEDRHPNLRLASDAWHADLNATGTFAELARSTFDADGFRIGAWTAAGEPLRLG